VDGMSNQKVQDAFNTIKQAMIDDSPSEGGSLAHSWHCNIAMACYDAINNADITDEQCMNEIHNVSNDAATRFMRICFDVETKQ